MRTNAQARTATSRMTTAEAVTTVRQLKCSTSRRSGTCAVSAPMLPISRPRPGEHGEAARREPVRGQLQNDQPGGGRGAANDRAAGAGHGEAAGCAEQAASPAAVEMEQKISSLRGPRESISIPVGICISDVGVKVERREAAEVLGADAERAHQLRGHHRGRGPQKEGEDVEDRRDAPDHDGEQDRRRCACLPRRARRRLWFPPRQSPLR